MWVRSYHATDSGPWAGPSRPALGLGDAGFLLASTHGYVELWEYTPWDSRHHVIAFVPFALLVLLSAASSALLARRAIRTQSTI